MVDRAESPKPMVKAPNMLGGRGTARLRSGRGFSLAEVREVGLTAEEARLLGIPVDARRRSSHELNIKALREYLAAIKDKEAAKPAMALVIETKQSKGRAFRGLTPAGRRSRGLYSIKLHETHSHKWHKKQKERETRKRHEAVRRKGGN